MFNAGSIIFRIQAIGAEVFQQDLSKADAAQRTLGQSSQKTAHDLQGFSDKQDLAQKGTRTFAQELRNLSPAGASAARTLLISMVGIGSAVATMTTLAVKKFASFDAELAQVRTLSHATKGEMEELSNAALTMGQNIGISANQVAQAESELVKAGVGVTEQLGGALPGALNLAASGQLDVAQATQIAAVAMTQFKLAGKDVPHLADLLAAGADKALGGVGELGQALNQGGLIASQFGLTIDDTVGTLAAFANAGLLGADAGTSLKSMLLQLASPTTQQQQLMEKLGITTYDTQGNFVGITALAGQLKDRLGGLSQAQRDSALSMIFGSYAIRAANVLYSEGADGIQGWIESVNDSGFASEQAAGKMDSLEGDVKKLGSSIDAALIKTGSGANEVLRGMVQVLTDLVQWYSSLPEPVQGFVLQAGIAITVVAAFGSVLLLVIPRIVAFRAAIKTLAEEMPGTTSKLRGFTNILGGPWMIAIIAAIAVLGKLQERNADYEARVDDLTSTLDANTGAFTANTRASVAKSLQDKGAYDAAKQLGISIETLTDAALGEGDAMEEVRKKVTDYQLQHSFTDGVLASFGQSVVQNVTGPLQTERDALQGAKDDHKALAEATEGNTDKTKDAAQAYLEAEDGASKLLDTLTDLINKINEANGTGQDAVSANARYRESLEDARKEIKDFVAEHGRGAQALDETTAAGSKNMAMLSDLAADYQNAAQKQFDLDHNTQGYLDSLAAGRDAVLQNAKDLGATDEQLAFISDHLVAMPSQKQIDLLIKTADGKRNIEELERSIARLQALANQGVNVIVRTGQVIANADGNIIKTFAGGGFENHVAQISRAGTTRIWSEPETGGEAYIPLSPAKRSRSLQIWEETGRLLGVDLSDVRPNVQTTTRKGDFNLTVVNPVSKDPVQDLRRGHEMYLAGEDDDV